MTMSKNIYRCVTSCDDNDVNFQFLQVIDSHIKQNITLNVVSYVLMLFPAIDICKCIVV